MHSDHSMAVFTLFFDHGVVEMQALDKIGVPMGRVQFLQNTIYLLIDSATNLAVPLNILLLFLRELNPATLRTSEWPLIHAPFHAFL